MLISSSEVGQRAVQHRNVINAAKAAGVKFIAYTSPLRRHFAAGSGREHIETEQMLADSGTRMPCCVTAGIPKTIPQRAAGAGAWRVYGAAGEGKIASATRADYAAAAARVIASEGHEGKIYELAGDNAWTLSDLVAELSKQSGKNVVYQNLSEADFAAALKGRPAGRACRRGYAGGFRDVGASKGGLFDDSRTSEYADRPPGPPLLKSVERHSVNCPSQLFAVASRRFLSHIEVG